MQKIAVDILEMHASHQCNLACTSCSHFSNHHVSQRVNLEAIRESLDQWVKLLDIGEFRILGGEPLLHPGLVQFLAHLRELPFNKLKLITNGLLLARHGDEFGEMLARNAIRVIVSVHSEEPEYLVKLADAKETLARWGRNYGLDYELRQAFRSWTRRYHGYGSDLRPYHDGSEAKSYSACTAKYCKQLHEGRIYKCGPVAYLPLLREKYSLSDEWNPFFEYKALEITASEDEIRKFFSCRSESICSLCPAAPEPFVKDPYGRD